MKAKALLFLLTAWPTVCSTTAAANLMESNKPPRPEATAQNDAKLFVIIYRPGPNWLSGVPMRDQGLIDHFHYMRELHESGRMLLAGPLGEDSGLVIVRAATKEEVDEIVKSDPAVVEGKFIGAVESYVPRFGELGVR